MKNSKFILSLMALCITTTTMLTTAFMTSGDAYAAGSEEDPEDIVTHLDEIYYNDDNSYVRVISEGKDCRDSCNFTEAFTMEEHDETGKIVSKKEYIIGYLECRVPGFCLPGNAEMFESDALSMFWRDDIPGYFLKKEYEYDSNGNLVARWENNIETGESDVECYNACFDWDENDDCIDEEYVCEGGELYVSASYTNKYDADDNLIGKYSSKGGDLIESYQEETPQTTKEVKRIYTVKEATEAFKALGTDTARVSLKYK